MQVFDLAILLSKTSKMTTNSTEAVKKHRNKKKLEQHNRQLKYNDLLRGEKKLNKLKAIDRQNIILSKNDPLTRLKLYFNDLIRNNFSNEKNCFFFTLTYSADTKIDMVENDKKVEQFLNTLSAQSIPQSIIVIPEYHSDRSRVHNHGIIKVLKGKISAFKKAFFNSWVRKNKGSVYEAVLKPKKDFEAYITKHIDEQDSGLLSASDSIQTFGIELNGTPERRVSKTRLRSIGNIRPMPSENDNAEECCLSVSNIPEVDGASENASNVDDSIQPLESEIKDNNLIKPDIQLGGEVASTNHGSRNKVLDILSIFKSLVEGFFRARNTSFEDLSLSFSVLYFLIALLLITAFRDILKL